MAVTSLSSPSRGLNQPFKLQKTKELLNEPCNHLYLFYLKTLISKNAEKSLLGCGTQSTGSSPAEQKVPGMQPAEY